MPKPRAGIEHLVRLSVPQEGRYEHLRLDKNERTIDFPCDVMADILRGFSAGMLSAYPEPAGLYRRLAALHNVTVDNVVVTAGSEMAIRYAFEAFLDRGDELVILNPSFAMFEVYGRLCGARVVPLDYDSNFDVSASRVIDAITPRTRVVAIANPNNPTGTVMSEQDLLAILAVAVAHDTLLLVDEAYYHFYPSTMAPYGAQSKHLIVTRTFSKACGLAGARLGYAIGNTDVIGWIKKLQPIDHASSLALRVGEYVLDHPEIVAEYVREVNAGKAFLVDQLRCLGLALREGAANFVLIDVGPQQEAIVQAMTREGILIASALRFPFHANYIRLTVGPVEQMKRVVGVLSNFFAGAHRISATAIARPAHQV